MMKKESLHRMPDEQEPAGLNIDIKKSDSSLLTASKGMSGVKGAVLSLICDRSEGDLHPSLYYFPFMSNSLSNRDTFDATSRRGGVARTRRERKRQARLSNNEKTVDNAALADIDVGTFKRIRFDPRLSEFTLLFFASTNCRNSNRVAPIVSDFLVRANTGEEPIASTSNTTIDNLTEPRQCQCIHVSHDNFMLAKSFCRGRGYHTLSCESGRHRNCHLLHQILFVRCIPCIVVIDNLTGKVLTDWGLQAIECNGSDAHYVLQAWRRNDPGLSLFQRGVGSCIVS